MPLKTTLESKITYRIKRSGKSVFLREDFADLGGYDQTGRVLRGLVKKGLLVKVGYGLYARARKSSLTGSTIPEKNLQGIAREALNRLGLEVAPTEAERAYNEGRSTHVPSGRRMRIVKGRCSRRIGYNGKYISYETASQRAGH